MTNLEALQATIGGNYPLDPNAYDKALLDADQLPYGLTALDGTAIYTSANCKTIDIVAAGLIFILLTNPSSVKEGGYEITQANQAALTQARAYLLGKYGISPTVATAFINNASNKW